MTSTLPFGSWPSPVSAADIASGATGLSELRALNDSLYWLESKPQEKGRTSLLSWHPARGTTELTPPPFNVRSRVHEYGGGAFLPAEVGVFFVNFEDQDLYLIGDDGGLRRLTNSGVAERFADLCWDPSRRRIIAVCERHHDENPKEAGADVSNCLVRIAIPETGEPGPPEILHEAHDFYAAPRLSPDARRLSFIAWDHPNMPWDGTLLKLADLEEGGTIRSETVLAGGASESVLQPDWLDSETLVFVSDLGGYWNLYRFDAEGIRCIREDDADYADPPWVFGLSSWVALNETHVLAVRHREQHSELVILDTHRGFSSPVSSHWVEHQYLCGSGSVPCFIGSHDDGPSEVVRYSFATAKPQVLARAGAPDLGKVALSRAEPISFPTRNGGRAFAYYYAPSHASIQGPAGERPPLVVMTHGGPTAAASPALNLRIQYFTSRGFAVIDVDYRGSSGYGRAYRDALNGQWGILDVTDCEDAVNWVVGRGLADSRRVVIRGGSAGGFTTLRALTHSRVFSAGASHYGIGDLTALANDTHKFESHYLQRLIGDPAELASRSPIRHVDRLSCPVIFFQGTDDRVVPPNQAREMVAALHRNALPVAYLEFPGEGHGFRQATNVARALASEYAFYCRVFQIVPSETLPDLEIDNL